MRNFISLFFLIQVCSGFSQTGKKLSFIDAYNKFRHSGFNTVSMIVDSIDYYSAESFSQIPANEFNQVDSIIRFEIDHAASLQAEMYWNKLYSKILRRNNFVGREVLLVNRNIEIADSLGDYVLLASAYDGLSDFYFNYGMSENALQAIWKTIEFAKMAGDSLLEKKYSSSVAWRLTNIGFDENNRAIQDSAVKFSLLSFYATDPRNFSLYSETAGVAALCLARAERRKDCLELANYAINHKQFDVPVFYIGLYPLIIEQYVVLNQKDSAYAYVEKLVEWSYNNESTRVPNILLEDGRRIFAGRLTSVINTYNSFADYSKAKNLLDKVLYNPEIDDPFLMTYFRSLAVDTYRGLGDYKRALECEIAVKNYKDSLQKISDQYVASSTKAIIEASIFLEKQNANKTQLQQQEILKKEETNKKLQFWIFTIVILSVVVFALVLLSRFKKTKEQKKIIEIQKLKVEEAHEEIKDSITYAKRIQTAILPPAKLIRELLPDSFVLYKPKDVVAGDFYWVYSLNPNIHQTNGVLFAVADCTGHGVPGAMVSVLCNGALNRAVREFNLTEPGLILDKAREIVIQEFEKSEEEVKDGMDLALCSIMGNQLQFAGAHNPVWILRNSDIIEIKADKQPVGKFENAQKFKTQFFELKKGDIIYIFSDGFADQFGGEKGKKLKAKNFRDLILKMKDQSLEEQKKFLSNAFDSWKGNLEQVDDICVIGVKV